MLTNRQLKEYINQARDGRLSSDKFNRICDFILKESNIDQLIVFVRNVKNVDLGAFGNRVWHEGDAEQNFEFATIDCVDSRAFRDRIIRLGDIEFNIRAGKQIRDEYHEDYINKHGQVVLKGSAYQNFKYLKHNKSKKLNRQAHLDAIINSGNTYVNYITAKEIEDADVQAHGDVIIKSKDIPTNMAFIKLENAKVYEHLQVISQYGSAYDNLDVIKCVDNYDISSNLVNIFSSSDEDVKYESWMWLKSKRILTRYKYLYPIRKFESTIKNANLEPEEVHSIS